MVHSFKIKFLTIFLIREIKRLAEWEEKNAKVNSSSDSSDAYSEDLLDMDKPKCSNSNSKSTKRTRLISLRSRINQNLTQDSDFINVLDSLQVERNTDENQATSNQSSAIQTLNTGPNLEIVESDQQNIEGKEEESESASTLVPTTSCKANESLKSLSSLKRKIEQNDDFFQPKRGGPTDDTDATSSATTTENEIGFNRPSSKEEKEKKRNYRNSSC